MADLIERPRRWLDDRFVAAGLVVAIVAVVLVRTALTGWAPIAADDALYLFVGLSVFGGHGPVTPGGDVFLLRSPVYPVMLASGSALVGGDPLDGARVVALLLAIACLLGAVRLGWLLGGAGGAVGTALVLAAVPVVWRLTPTLRIDLPQTAGVIAILLAAWRPTTSRWALAGILFGLTVLVKETVLPLALLPVALVGSGPSRRVATLWGAYLGAALLTAGWWWVAVWFGDRAIFPLNNLAVVGARDVAHGLGLGRVMLLLGGAAVVAWGVMVVRARTELGPRLMVVAAVCLLPAAAYAASQSLDPRNYAGLAVLSAVALGVAGAMAVRVLWARAGTRRLARASLVGLVVLAVGGGIAAGQRSVGPAPPPGTADALATWLRANTTGGDRIAMTFRDRESMALRLFGVVEVANLPLVRVNAKDDPGAFLWMGLRGRQLFGYRRAAWTRVLTDPTARYLALSGPHPFHPTELVRAMVAGRVPGLDRVAWFDEGTDHADVFAVDAASLALAPEAVPTSLSSDAALAWLDLAAPVLGADAAVARLLAARPEVSGRSLPALQARLGTCALPSGADGPVTLTPADACGG